jgi:hypothetical protein
MKKFTLVFTLLLITAMMITGCERLDQGQKIDMNKTVETIKTEVKNMDVAELKAMALKYKNAIMAKKEDVNKMMGMIGQFDLDAATKKAEQTKEDVFEIMAAMKILAQHYDVYIDRLKELKADISGLTL